jgi:hypothetical protein
VIYIKINQELVNRLKYAIVDVGLDKKSVANNYGIGVNVVTRLQNVNWSYDGFLASMAQMRAKGIERKKSPEYKAMRQAEKLEKTQKIEITGDSELVTLFSKFGTNLGQLVEYFIKFRS